jgi:hypothetical protein
MTSQICFSYIFFLLYFLSLISFDDFSVIVQSEKIGVLPFQKHAKQSSDIVGCIVLVVKPSPASSFWSGLLFRIAGWGDRKPFFFRMIKSEYSVVFESMSVKSFS